MYPFQRICLTIFLTVKGVMTVLDQYPSLCWHTAGTADIFPDPSMAHLPAVQSRVEDELTSP